MKLIFLAVATLFATHSAFAVKSRTQPVLPAFAAEPLKTQTGVASWYGSGFIGGKTANGEIYRFDDKTAAHKSLPFGTWVRVTDQRSGRNTIVRINNRGPFVRGRVIDLSRAAASEIGLTSRGLASVKLEILRSLPRDAQPTVAENGPAQMPLTALSAPTDAVQKPGIFEPAGSAAAILNHVALITVLLSVFG